MQLYFDSLDAGCRPVSGELWCECSFACSAEAGVGTCWGCGCSLGAACLLHPESPPLLLCWVQELILLKNYLSKKLIPFWTDQVLIPAPHVSIVCAEVLHCDRRQGISYSSSWLACYLKEKYLTRSLFEKLHTI